MKWPPTNSVSNSASTRSVIYIDADSIPLNNVADSVPLLLVECKVPAEETQEADAQADYDKIIQENKVAKTTQLFMRGIGNEGDSKADALNAFTEYFDHDHVAETKKKVNAAKEAARGAKALTSSFEGHGAEVKHRVRQRLLATV